MDTPVASDEMQLQADDVISALSQSRTRAVAHTHMYTAVLQFLSDGLRLKICEFLSIYDLIKPISFYNRKRVEKLHPHLSHRSYSRLDLHAFMEPGIQIYPADGKQTVSSIIFGVPGRVFCDCFSMTSTEATATLIGVY